MQKITVAVIGGGAAGFFAAISCAQHHPHAQVILLEKSPKLLAKVKVSGGGRCNVAPACFNDKELAASYPRGGKELRGAFAQFSVKDTIKWFESRDVALKTEDDGRMFPITDSSQTIIDCLLQEAQRLNVRIVAHTDVTKLERAGEEGWLLHLGGHERLAAASVVVASGGSPKAEGLRWLQDLGHSIVSPLPSLFTFNLPNDPIKELMGVSVPMARVRLPEGKFEFTGPLLITHWGMSGPAVLKLSAFAAKWLAERQYKFAIHICWLPSYKEEVREEMMGMREGASARQFGNKNPFGLPTRLWEFLAWKAGVPLDKLYRDLSNKDINRMAGLISCDMYQAQGKTTYKEEFVTCGGVLLSEVNFKTMQSKICPGLSFAGEVLDIDGITGGFNFQAAWTTGFIAGKHALSAE